MGASPSSPAFPGHPLGFLGPSRLSGLVGPELDMLARCLAAVCLHAFTPPCLLAWLACPSDLSAFMHGLHACLPACLACLPACLPARLVNPWVLLDLSWGLSWGPPGALLGPSWGSPGRSPGPVLGLPWVPPLRLSWGHPGARLGLSGFWECYNII